MVRVLWLSGPEGVTGTDEFCSCRRKRYHAHMFCLSLRQVFVGYDIRMACVGNAMIMGPFFPDGIFLWEGAYEWYAKNPGIV